MFDILLNVLQEITLDLEEMTVDEGHSLLRGQRRLILSGLLSPFSFKEFCPRVTQARIVSEIKILPINMRFVLNPKRKHKG